MSDVPEPLSMRLCRNDWKSDRVFGTLFDQNMNQICKTMEPLFDGKPKIPDGSWTCIRGDHTLKFGVPIHTFEVRGVSGHWGLLFHTGNRPKDSNGCILVGVSIVPDPYSKLGEEMLSSSKVAFGEFMKACNGWNAFPLSIRSVL